MWKKGRETKERGTSLCDSSSPLLRLPPNVRGKARGLAAVVRLKHSHAIAKPRLRSRERLERRRR